MFRMMLLALGLAAVFPVSAQNAAAWLEAQGLEAAEPKTFQDLEIVGNKASRVGGVAVTNWAGATADVRIDNVLFAGNSATGDCGALRIASQTAPPPNFEITDSVFEKNKSKGWGGAACFQGKDYSTDVDPVQIVANAV